MPETDPKPVLGHTTRLGPNSTSSTTQRRPLQAGRVPETDPKPVLGHTTRLGPNSTRQHHAAPPAQVGRVPETDPSPCWGTRPGWAGRSGLLSGLPPSPRPISPSGRRRTAGQAEVARKERSRRLLLTTKTDDNAIAAPASIGLSSPAAATGRAATL